MIDSVALTLYIKRVLREVRRHSSDTDIDRKIIGEIEERVLRLTGGRTDEESIRAALKKMEPASELGLQYRAEYKYSAEKPDGFLIFERFFSSIAAMALLLLTVFVVFRLFPQKEYVGYAVCACAGVAAAFLAHRRFYNIHYALATIWVPAFLLLYYPCKHAIAAVRASGGSFLSAFFSYRYHVVFLVLIFITAAYTATTAILHAAAYLRGHKRVVSYLAAVVCSVGFLCGFFCYAVHLKGVYNAEASVCLAATQKSYEVYAAGGTIRQAQTDAKTLGDLYDRYAGIYVPSNRQTGGAYSSLLEMLDLYDSDVDSLILRYHPAYEPDKRPKNIQTEPIDEKVSEIKRRLTVLLAKDTGEEPFRSLIDVETCCDLFRQELLLALSDAYNAWIYQ